MNGSKLESIVGVLVRPARYVVWWRRKVVPIALSWNDSSLLPVLTTRLSLGGLEGSGEHQYIYRFGYGKSSYGQHRYKNSCFRYNCDMHFYLVWLSSLEAALSVLLLQLDVALLDR